MLRGEEAVQIVAAARFRGRGAVLTLLNTALAKALPDEPATAGKRKNLLGGIAGAVALRVAAMRPPAPVSPPSSGLPRTWTKPTKRSASAR